MIVHMDSFSNGSIVESDVCIVGAGPIGLQLGRFLSRCGIQVVVVESGEENPSSRIQDLNTGSQSGRNAGELRDIRIRQFGGTMHVWGGNCRPLDPIDFQTRSWVPNSGWPISFADLQPYLREAHDLLKLGEFFYAPKEESFLAGNQFPALHFEETLFRLTRFVRGTGEEFLGDWGGYYYNEISRQNGMKVILGCNVTQIFLSDNKNSISELYALSFQGREMHLRAKAFVFCCGGIENPRLLLASREDLPDGIGNEGDSVGRYFMEHPHGLAALLVCGRDDLQKKLSLFSPGYNDGDAAVQHRFRLTNKAQRERGMLNLVFQVVHKSMSPEVQDLYEDIFHEMQGALLMKENVNSYYLVFLSEQIPSRSSRVTVSGDTDFFGMPKAHLHWEIGEIDFKTVYEGLQILMKEFFPQPDFNGVSLVAPSSDDWLLGYGAHHMGTTRMSNTSADGVVDRNCRIHGVTNGFCAGSSVFATSGMANPTLTAIALALRLGQHLVANLPFMRPVDRFACPRRPKHLEVMFNS